MFRAAVLLSMCLVLASGKPVGVPSGSEDVERQTASAVRALSSLPSHCTAGLPALIETERLKTLGSFDNCNITGIINNFAYMLIDSANFGGKEYRAFTQLINNNTACVQGDLSAGDKIECVINELMSQNMFDILEALKVYVYQLENLITPVVNEIKECRTNSVRRYQLFLDNLLEKAVIC